VKFPQAVCKISCSHTFSTLSQTHRWTHGQPENVMPPAANQWQRHNKNMACYGRNNCDIHQ